MAHDPRPSGANRISGSAGSLGHADVEDSRVVAALLDYQKLIEQQQAPSRSRFLARHPEIADSLAAALDGMAVMNHVATGIRNLPPPPKLPRPENVTSTLPLGDFQIIREIGRGGMGVVYEAEQLSLGRRVALKVLPFAAALDGKQLARFKNEAYAAAHLHHSNIVPVFAVGSDRGVHYYAMQFIDGQTLADFIRERKGQERQLAPHDTALDSSSSGNVAGVGSPPPPSSLIDVLATSKTAPYQRPTVLSPAPPARRPGPAEPVLSPVATSTRALNNLSTKIAGKGQDYYKTLARWGLQAAEALEYAHGMGVVHRDIKPANMLIDDRGHIWVTDFGLAHFRQNADLTLSGDLLGTARYMSPEQTRGERGQVDWHTDIYSLGATLYELFTLKHAFDGKGWNDLLRQIAQEEPMRPRRVRPDMPLELEIIVQKAMAKNPQERYATAGDLADDLRRFLEDQPIRARRPSTLQIASKWARRHRPVIFTALVLLILSLLGLSWFYWQLYLETAARERANSEGLKSERLAREAVDEMYVGFGEKWLKNQPQLQPVQRELLEKARDFYTRFARLPAQTPDLRQGRAIALLRVAEIEAKFKNYAKAQEAIAEAIPLFRSLMAELPSNRSYPVLLARAHDLQGTLHLELRDLKAALDSYEQAVAIDRKLLLVAPPYERREHVIAFCTHLANLGHAFHRLRQYGPARDNLKQSLDQLEEQRREAQDWLRANDDNKDAKLVWYRNTRMELEPELARTHLLLGTAQQECGNLTEAERHWNESLTLCAKLAEDYPDEHRFKSIHAQTLKQIGQLCHESGQYRVARRFLSQARDVNEWLAARTEFAGYHQDTADCLTLLARVARERGSFSEAIELYQAEFALRERLATGDPREHRYLAVCRNNLGHVYLECQRVADAVEAFQDAIAREAQSVDRFQASAADRHRLAIYRNNLAKALWLQGRLDAAEDNYRQALTLSDEVLDGFPHLSGYRPLEFRDASARLHRNFALFMIERGNLREAEQELRLALAQEHKLRVEVESEPRWYIACAQTHQRLAWLYERQRLPGLALQEESRAAWLLREVASKLPRHAEALNSYAWQLASSPYPENRDLGKAAKLVEQAALADVRQDATQPDCKRTQGLIALRNGEAKQAVLLLEESIRQRERRDAVTLMLLALACAQADQPQKAADLYVQACEENRKKSQLDPDFLEFQNEFRAHHAELVRVRVDL